MDLHKILDSQLAGWRADAACRDEPDEKLFISDRALSRIQPASPTLVAAMATCARCDVRKSCLAEALTPVVSPVVRSDERAGAFRSNGSISHMRLTGVWGGTTDDDRHTVAHLPLPEAVDVLEASFPERLAAMADLFERSGVAGRRRRADPAAPRRCSRNRRSGHS